MTFSLKFSNKLVIGLRIKFTDLIIKLEKLIKVFQNTKPNIHQKLEVRNKKIVSLGKPIKCLFIISYG